MRNSTQTISLSVVLMAAISTSAWSQTSGEAKSAVTVEALLSLENSIALEKAAARAKDLGLVKEPPAPTAKNVIPVVVPPASLSVSRIAGVGSDVKASVNYNGAALENVVAGSKVGPCVVQAIENACVVLQKAPSPIVSTSVKKGPNRQPTREAEQCPRACWTGIALDGAFQQQYVGPPGAPPLPPGMPVGAVAQGQNAAGMVGAQRMGSTPTPAVAGRVQQAPNPMQFTGTPNVAQVRPGSIGAPAPSAAGPVGQRTN